MGLFLAGNEYRSVNGYGNSELTASQDYLSRLADPDGLQGSDIQVGFLDSNLDGMINSNEQIKLFAQTRLAGGQVVYLTFDVTSNGLLQVNSVLDKSGGEVKLAPGLLDKLKAKQLRSTEMKTFLQDWCSVGLRGLNPIASVSPSTIQVTSSTTNTPWGAWDNVDMSSMNVYGLTDINYAELADRRKGGGSLDMYFSRNGNVNSYVGKIVSANDGTRDLLLTIDNGSTVRLVYRPPSGVNDADPTHGSFYAENSSLGCMQNLGLNGLKVDRYGTLQLAYVNNRYDYTVAGHVVSTLPDGTLKMDTGEVFVFDSAQGCFVSNVVNPITKNDQQVMDDYGSDFNPVVPPKSATDNPSEDQKAAANDLINLLALLSVSLRIPEFTLSKEQSKDLLKKIAKLHPKDFIKIFLDQSNPKSVENLKVFNALFSKTNGYVLKENNGGVDADSLNNMASIQSILGGAFYSVAFGLAGTALPKTAAGAVDWASINSNKLPDSLNNMLSKLQSMGHMQTQINQLLDGAVVTQRDRVYLVQSWTAGVQDLSAKDLDEIKASGQQKIRLDPARAIQSLGQLFFSSSGNSWVRKDISSSSQHFLGDVIDAYSTMYAGVSLNLNNQNPGSAGAMITYFDRANFACSALCGVASNAYSAVSSSASNWFTDHLRSSYEFLRSFQDATTKVYDKINEGLLAATRN